MTGQAHEPGLPDGTRLAFRRGNPTAEEVAAVVVALDAARRRERAPRVAAAPAWQRAAHLEAVGGGPVSSPADLPRVSR